MAYDAEADVHFVQINYEHQLKTAGYLIGAHSACLLLVLASLKDYSPKGPLSGVGVFVVIFGIGLLAGILNYATMSLARSVAINAARDEKDSDEATNKFLTRVHLSALSFSLGLFVLGLIIAMFKFGGL